MKTLALAMSLVACLATPGLAADVEHGALTISGAFARASAGMAKAGGGFMTIANIGCADQLVGASADVSERTELHTHIKDGEVMRMRKVETIDVPREGTLELKPGSYHVMFINLHAPLKEGQVIPVELEFRKAGKVSVDVEVGSVGAKAPAKHMTH